MNQISRHVSTSVGNVWWGTISSKYPTKRFQPIMKQSQKQMASKVLDHLFIDKGIVQQ